MDVTLDDLVCESEQLLMDVQGDTDLPRITRNLDQMRQLGDKLYLSRGARLDEVKAARLLGPKLSYELPALLSAKLEQEGAVDSKQKASSSDASDPTLYDVNAYLKAQRENALLDVISSSQKSIASDIDSRCDLQLDQWWRQEASAILSSLATCSSSASIDTLMPEVKSGPASFGSTPGGQGRSREELWFAKQFDHYLTMILPATSTGGSSPSCQLVNLLVDAYQRQGHGQGHNERRQLIDLWRLVGQLTNTAASLSSQGRLQASPLINDSALAYLADDFRAYMLATVNASSTSSSSKRLLGGRPSTLTLARAYLSTVAGSLLSDEGCEFEDGLIDSQPVWPLIYCCLRAGDLDSAVEVANLASNNLGAFASLLQEFQSASGVNRIGPSTNQRVRQKCSQVAKLAVDPYKRLIHSIIGHHDTANSHSEVARNIDDFIWVKLSQIDDDDGSDQQNTSVLTAGVVKMSCGGQNDVNRRCITQALGQLQSQMHDTYGESHFNAWSQPLVYFKVLFLTQQFEAALGFLSRFTPYRCHAVHMALAMHQANVLCLSDNVQLPMVTRVESDPPGLRRLNFARLVLLYTRSFELSSPDEALAYFYCLSDVPMSSSGGNKVEQQSAVRELPNLFINCLCELLLTSREPGAIDRYFRPSQLQPLIHSIAEMFEVRGLIVDAVKLFQLAAASCSDQQMAASIDRAIQLVNQLLSGLAIVDDNQSNDLHQTAFKLQQRRCRELSTTVATSSSSQVDRAVLIELGSQLAHKARQLITDTTNSVPSSDFSYNANTLFFLLDLAALSDLELAGSFKAALQLADQLTLAPTTCDQVDECRTHYRSLSDLAQRPLPNAFLTLMRSIVGRIGELVGPDKVSQVSRDGGRNRLHLDFSTSHSQPYTNLTPFPSTPLDDSSLSLGSPASSTELNQLRERSRALVIYAGHLPMGFNSDVCSRLSRMNIELV